MQPDQARVIEIEARRSPLDAERSAVRSRRRALDRLRAAIPGGLGGPVLITGEPGSGKTWLVRRFVEGLPTGWQAAEVEMTSTLSGVEMLRLVGDDLGLEMPRRLGAARLSLGAGLRDASADGRSRLLVIDEAQRATADAWEEIQVLSNQLGRRGGFAAMILLGRTELARELASQHRHGWANRLGLHIHLPPLDLDEARALVRLAGPIPQADLETLHRDAMGNARAMLRIAEVWARTARAAVPASPDLPRRDALSRPSHPPVSGEPRLNDRPGEEASPAGLGASSPANDTTPPRLPSLIPARPPIRLEEGLVEVGWEGDLEAETTRSDVPRSEPAAGSALEAERNEELVEDRYAALQAWAEWSRNREQGAPATAHPANSVNNAPDEDDDAEPNPAGSMAMGENPDSVPPSSVRAELPHDFAPYSQLFSRLRHSL
jgi:type II secretory pathway predicted ATPase ExeA